MEMTLYPIGNAFMKMASYLHPLQVPECCVTTFATRYIIKLVYLFV